MSRLFFDITEQGKSRVRALQGRGRAVIGTSAAAEVQLATDGVFDQHAALDVDSLVLEALAPGLTVDGKPVPMGGKVVLEPGTRVAVGGATLDLVVWRPVTARVFSSHEYFEQRGAEECLRCARRKATFSVLHVRLPVRERDAELEAGLASAVRLTDVVAAYGPGIYELLVFDTAADGARQVAGRVERILEHLKTQCVVGLASYPTDGSTIDELAQFATQKALGITGEDSISTSRVRVGEENVVEKVARSELSILVLGETGSGKEVLAARVHKLSRRAEKPFVKLNCAAFTESLLESELFGHERGSFTGAVGTKLGLLETADGGTVFLDEIGEMPLSMQAKVLRVLEERVVMRVGGLKPRSIDVRFIAATNRDLEAEVARGRFRSDLFFRLDGATLIVQPLRNRLDEFDAIAADLLADLASRGKLPVTPQVSPNAMQLLKTYTWPGNIRELRNMLERAVWLAEGGIIHRSHLPVDKLQTRFAEYRPGRYAPAAAGTQTTPEGEPGGSTPYVATAVPGPAPRPAASGSGSGSWPVEKLLKAPASSPPSPGALEPAALAPAPPAPARGRGFGLLVADEHRVQMAAQERAVIEAMLAQCGGNQSEAARRLGVSRRTLVKRIEAYGLVRPRKHREAKGAAAAAPDAAELPSKR